MSNGNDVINPNPGKAARDYHCTLGRRTLGLKNNRVVKRLSYGQRRWIGQPMTTLTVIRQQFRIRNLSTFCRHLLKEITVLPLAPLRVG